MYTVYQVSGPEGKVYIGLTAYSEYERWKLHIRNSRNKKNNWYFYNAIRKHGAENFKVFLLDKTYALKEAKEMEKLYIRLLQSNDPEFGYNSTSGGDAIEFTEETIKKMSLIGKTRWENSDFKTNTLAKRATRPHPFLGRKLSPEHNKKKNDGYKAWIESGNKPRCYRSDISDEDITREYKDCKNFCEVGRRLGINNVTARNRYRAANPNDCGNKRSLGRRNRYSAGNE